MAGGVPAVVASGLAKSYGRLWALRQVDLMVAPGSFLLITGPSGAGKSTLLGLVAGLLRPTAGELRVLAGDPGRDPAVRRRVGIVAEQPMLYEELSAAENLRFFARLYGVQAGSGRIALALERVGLLRRADSRVRTLSRGMKQRLAWARAVLHEPRLLLLDEPFSGLDQHGTELLLAQLHALRERGVTCLLATHQPQLVQELADQRLRLLDGRVVCRAGATEKLPIEPGKDRCPPAEALP